MLRKNNRSPQVNASPKMQPSPLLIAKIVILIKEQFFKISFHPPKLRQGDETVLTNVSLLLPWLQILWKKKNRTDLKKNVPKDRRWSYNSKPTDRQNRWAKANKEAHPCRKITKASRKDSVFSLKIINFCSTYYWNKQQPNVGQSWFHSTNILIWSLC